jgi:hypothetical protein
MTSIYKYGYLVCNNSFSRTFTKLPAFTNIGTYRLLDEKVLLLPVVYEKYNYLLLSMNFNAEFYKFYFTEKNFSKVETCSTTWFWLKISKRN